MQMALVAGATLSCAATSPDHIAVMDFRFLSARFLALVSISAISQEEEVTDSSSEPTILSEELAHRVLARAVEIDVLQRSGTTLERLREVSRELGIPDHVLETAWAETRRAAPTQTRSTLGRLLDRVRGRQADQTLAEQVVANLAAGVSFWALLSFLRISTRGLSDAWQFEQGLTLSANIVGVFIARHLRAKPFSFILTTTAVAQLAEYVVHLVFGIANVQGAPTHWAILLASAIGIAASRIGTARPSMKAVTDVSSSDQVPETHQSSWSLLRKPLVSVEALPHAAP